MWTIHNRPAESIHMKLCYIPHSLYQHIHTHTRTYTFHFDISLFMLKRKWWAKKTNGNGKKEKNIIITNRKQAQTWRTAKKQNWHLEMNAFWICMLFFLFFKTQRKKEIKRIFLSQSMCMYLMSLTRREWRELC